MTAMEQPSTSKRQELLKAQPETRKGNEPGADKASNGSNGANGAHGTDGSTSTAAKKLSRKEASNRTRAYQFALTDACSSADAEKIYASFLKFYNAPEQHLQQQKPNSLFSQTLQGLLL